MVPFTGHLADKLEPGKAMMFGLFILGIGTLPGVGRCEHAASDRYDLWRDWAFRDHVRATVHHEHGSAIFVVGEIKCGCRHRELRTPNGWISWYKRLGRFCRPADLRPQ